MSDLYPLNALTVIKLLQPDANSDDLAECEERDHPWLTPAKGPPIDRPLLRLWDKNSGSQPGEKWSGFMLARAQQQPLHDAKSRTESLKIHAKNDEWVPTPYISFSSSPKAIEDLAAYRKTKRRGRQWLTAINPGVREAKGLPVLDIGAEMEHYRILNPYPYRNNYYENHYICLWEVTPEEIVRKWKWKKLMKDNEKDWYEQIVLPAFQRHNDDPTDWSEWTDSDSDSADDSDSSDDSDSDSSDDSDSDSSSGLSEVAGFIA